MTEEKQKLEKKEISEKEQKEIKENPKEIKKEDKTESKIEKTIQPEIKLEKEFIIPLRRKFGKTARYKRASKAIKAIKEFLLRHMKIYDKDLKKIKLDKYLNEFIWARGIKNPPSRVRVKVISDGNFIKAELAELTEKLKFKKEKLERREKKNPVPLKKPKSENAPQVKEKTEEEKAEEKEKKAAVIEAGKKMEKDAARQAKHTTKDKKGQPKRQQRMALAK